MDTVRLIQDNDLTAEFGDPSYPEFPTEPGAYAVGGLWRVTEWRNRDVFKTIFVRHLWIPMEFGKAVVEHEGETFLLNAVSDKHTTEWMESGKRVIVTVLPS